MNTKKIFIGLLILLFSVSASATFKKATKLYDKQKFEQAFNMFYDLAQLGHKGSQFNIGVMYLDGAGVKQDLVKAYSWIKLSDESDNKEQELMAEIRSKISDAELREIDDYYAHIYEKFSNEAIKQAYAPEIKDNEKKVSSPKPIEQKEARYPAGAQVRGYTGWVKVSFSLSTSGYPIDIMVEDSFPREMFVKASLRAVKKWRFEPTSNQKRYLYKMDFRLDGLGENNRREYNELKNIRDEAMDGEPSSQYLHARYGNYNLAKNDNFSPASWYYEAARNGVLNAQYELAERLFEGNGCEVDTDKAFNWLKSSAEGDFPLSQFKLAKLAYQNKEKEKALVWLKKALRSNSSIKSIDTEKTAFELVSFIYSNNIKSIQPELILEQLDLVGEDNIKNPVRLYLYYANVHESLGNTEEALDYLEQAVESLEDLGEERIPQEMLEKLTRLEGIVT